MKITLVNFLYPPDGIGGSERSTRFLALGLKNLGHDVSVICQAVAEKDIQEDDEGISVYRLGSPPGYQPNVLDVDRNLMNALKKKNKRKYVPFVNKYKKLVETLQPDIVHTSVIPSPPKLWSATASLGFPIVHTLRSYNLICKNRMFANEMPCQKWCNKCRDEFKTRRKDTKLISGLVGISEHVLRAYLDRGMFSAASEVAVIPNSFSSSNPQEIGPANQFLLPPLEDGRLKIGYIGRIHETKGIERFINRFREFASPNMELKIAGTGNPQYIEHLQTAYRDDRIEYVGFVKPEDFFPTIHVGVTSSLWAEPFGRTTIEGMIMGRPMLGTRIGGTAELIKDGITGWLYDPYSDQELKNWFKMAASLKLKDIIQMSKNTVEQGKLYRPDIVAASYLDIYQKTLKSLDK